jgi:hypothetical protein
LWGFAGAFASGAVATPSGNAPISTANLVIVDPQSPAAPVTLESAGQWVQQERAIEASVDLAARVATNIEDRIFTYAKGDRLYRVDLRRTGSTPAAVQMSSASTTQLCPLAAGLPPSPTWSANDFASADRSMYGYRSTGPDNTCGTLDDALIAIRANMGPADAPIAALPVLSPLRSPDGALDGFLVRSGMNVQRVDTNFASPTTLFTGPVGRVYQLMTQALEELLIFDDGASVKIYNLTTGSGPTSVFSLNTGERLQLMGTDDSGAYFELKTAGPGGRVLRVGYDGGATVLATESAGLFAWIGLTPSRVVYRSGASIKSVLKTGGVATTIASPAAPWTIVRNR